MKMALWRFSGSMVLRFYFHDRRLSHESAVALGGGGDGMSLRFAPRCEWAKRHYDGVLLEHPLPGAHHAPVDHDDRVEDPIAAGNDQGIILRVERRAAIAVCHQILVEGR